MLRILLVLLLLPFSVFAAKKDIVYGNITPSRINAIYDGDTFYVDVDEWPDVIGKNIKVRISGIDTPEIRTKCKEEKRLGRLAKQFAVERLRAAKKVELKNLKRGKYFRVIADVYVDGLDLGEMLISAGHARRYDGGTREAWCSDQLSFRAEID